MEKSLSTVLRHRDRVWEMGMEKPLVSIIVPVYNAESCICKCVDSILSQTYENIEVLLINDGSGDGSESVIRDCYTNDSRVIYVNKPHEGGSRARNYGIEKANGSYLAYFFASLVFLRMCFIIHATPYPVIQTITRLGEASAI